MSEFLKGSLSVKINSPDEVFLKGLDTQPIKNRNCFKFVMR